MAGPKPAPAPEDPGNGRGDRTPEVVKALQARRK